MYSHRVLSDSLQPLDCSPPGSSVHGISRQESWSGLPLLTPGIFPTQGWNPCFLLGTWETCVCMYVCIYIFFFSYFQGNFDYCFLKKFFWICCFYEKVLVTQFCLTLCDSKDSNLPGSSVHGISQARILEWIAIHLSRNQTWISCIADGLSTV